MKFHVVPVDQAEGCILAHATAAAPMDAPDPRLIPKGTVLGADHIQTLMDARVRDVLVAQLEDGDIAEDQAATRIAVAIADGHTKIEVTQARAGRVNLKAQTAGIVDLDADRLNAMNLIDPSLTVATLPNWKKVNKGALIATIKIIPFAAQGIAVDAACKIVRGAIRVSAPIFAAATLIETRLGQDAPPDKGRRSTEKRLRAFGMSLTKRQVVAHDADALAQAIRGAQGDIVLVLTATATSDARDTAPAAVRLAGGVVDHFGMPVDPGNLLFIGAFGDKPVIGLPGCARSPALNGADWVLERIICGHHVGKAEISAMGVGGLLKEIPDRGRARS